MKIGILGGNGFLGRYLSREYLDNGCIVYSFYNSDKSLISDECIAISITSNFKIQLDCLIVSIGGHYHNHSNFLEQNTFLQTLMQKISFTKIIFISSIEIYGRHFKPLTVNSCLNSPNLYGLSKLSQEFILKSFDNCTIIRPTYIYGLGMNRNSLIPKWVLQAKKEHRITVYGNGHRMNDYLHVNDFCRLCWLVTVSKKTDTLIAASGKSITNNELANIISNQVQDCELVYLGTDEAPSYRFDILETKINYNWEPKITVEDGLKEYILNENIDL